MSSPRPIHIPSREILKEPHDSEPPHSFDNDPSPLLDEEDDFHNRLSKNRRESSGSAQSGGSFWRTSGDSPAFSSAQMKKSTEMVPENRSTGGGLLANALQTQQTDSVSSVSSCVACVS